MVLGSNDKGQSAVEFVSAIVAWLMISVVASSVISPYTAGVIGEKGTSANWERLQGINDEIAHSYVDGLRARGTIFGTNATLSYNNTVADLNSTGQETLDDLGVNVKYADSAGLGDDYVLKVSGTNVTFARVG